MKHLGDISKINGADIDPVDIITFGSPCQDLSVAGKRAGLKGARSGLFMEAVRIIREMREATNGQYPTFALWENVPGAFSSNKGEDFQAVLEELIKISEPGAVMPEVPKKGWAYADSYVGNGWSLAYRVFDTQYWPRTPQRRRRIYLVADFRGQRARKVLFEREGLRGHLTESSTTRERITAYVEGSLGTADSKGDNLNTLYVTCYESHPLDSRIKELEDDICPTVTAKWHKGAADTPLVCIREQYLFENHSQDSRYKGPLDICPMLPAQLGTGGNNTPFVVGKHSAGLGSYHIVRRLTPTECARLQGFPDTWGHPDEKNSLSDEEYNFWLEVRNTHAAINGKAVKEYTKDQMLKWHNKLHSDSAEYKMWGNGIALPPTLYCMQGMAEELHITQ